MDDLAEGDIVIVQGDQQDDGSLDATTIAEGGLDNTEAEVRQAGPTQGHVRMPDSDSAKRSAPTGNQDPHLRRVAIDLEGDRAARGGTPTAGSAGGASWQPRRVGDWSPEAVRGHAGRRPS